MNRFSHISSPLFSSFSCKDNQNQASTYAFMLQDTEVDTNLIMLAFKGTKPFNAYGWDTDTDISWYKLKGIGQIYCGFIRALGLQTLAGLRKLLNKIMTNCIHTMKLDKC